MANPSPSFLDAEEVRRLAVAAGIVEEPVEPEPVRPPRTRRRPTRFSLNVRAVPRRDTMRSEAVERPPTRLVGPDEEEPHVESPYRRNAPLPVHSAGDGALEQKADEPVARQAHETIASEPAGDGAHGPDDVSPAHRLPADTADDCFVAPPSLVGGVALTEAFDRLLDWAMVASGATGSFVADDAGFALARRHIPDDVVAVADAMRRSNISIDPSAARRGFGILRVEACDVLGILWWSGHLGLLYIGLQLPSLNAARQLERMLDALDGST